MSGTNRSRFVYETAASSDGIISVPNQGAQRREAAVAASASVHCSDKPRDKEQGEVAARALVAKLVRALAVSPDRIDAHKHLSDCGVDSRIAVELSNWDGLHFRAEAVFFDITGKVTIAAIGKLVLEGSGLRIYGENR